MYTYTYTQSIYIYTHILKLQFRRIEPVFSYNSRQMESNDTNSQFQHSRLPPLLIQAS